MELLKRNKVYNGELRKIPPDKITSYEIFSAYDYGDEIAVNVIKQCIEFWGMAVANLVSLLRDVAVRNRTNHSWLRCT